MYPCAVLSGPWSLGLGPWSVLWSKVLGPHEGPSTKNGPGTRDGPGTKNGPGTKDQGQRTTAAVAVLIVGAAFATATAQRGAPPAPAPMPAVLRDYRPVTAARLKTPEDENWLMIRRTYDGWGFSPLAQITPANVARLRPVWVFSTAEARVHQAAPLVNGGVMFVTSPNNQVIAIDVTSGNLLWRYRRPRTAAMSVPHETNRGVALYGDKVYFAAGEAVHVAVDAPPGREVRNTADA